MLRIRCTRPALSIQWFHHGRSSLHHLRTRGFQNTCAMSVWEWSDISVESRRKYEGRGDYRAGFRIVDGSVQIIRDKHVFVYIDLGFCSGSGSIVLYKRPARSVVVNSVVSVRWRCRCGSCRRLLCCVVLVRWVTRSRAIV